MNILAEIIESPGHNGKKVKIVGLTAQGFIIVHVDGTVNFVQRTQLKIIDRDYLPV